MTMLPANLADAEKATREAIRAKWDALPDSGIVWGRERYVDSLTDYLKLVAIKDEANGNKPVIRAAFVRLVHFEPMTDDSSVCKTPVRLFYEIDVMYQFEDTRKDGTNSTDDFNALLMRGHHAFENDQNLGFEDLNHNFLDTAQDAEVLSVKGSDVDCHTITLSINCEVYVNG